jgi:dipeptidyl aminopeptidase/acylaminoacyl peptidase
MECIMLRQGLARMPILRMFVRTALVLMVVGVVMCGVAVGSGAMLESRILAVSLRRNATSHVGLLDMNTHIFYVHPIEIPVWFSNANWSPNGRYILAVQDDDVTNIFDTQTGSFVQILDRVYCDWSPDNYHLACRDISNNSTLIITRDITQTYFLSDLIHANSVEWSPDGQALAFAVYDGTSSQVYVSNLDTLSSRQIARFSKEVIVGTFSPNGRFLTAHLASAERWETYIIDLDTSATFSLNDDLGLAVDRVSEATWSPDSNYFVFQVVTHIDSPFNYGPLYITDLGSFTTQRLAENGIRPQWSPDGTEIVFESPEPINSQTGHLNLYIAAIDGTNPRLITDSGWYAVWIDDEQIALEAPEGLYRVDRTANSQVQLLYFPRSESEFICNFALWR